MTDSSWSPPRTLELRRVLSEGTLHGLRIGDPPDRIEATLGPPQAPPQPIGRRSKLRSWLYGNVTVLSTAERVEGIEIDFEGSHPRLVEAGEMGEWTLDRWRTFARDEDWEARERSPVIQLVGAHAIVGLDEDGALHVVSLRAPVPAGFESK